MKRFTAQVILSNANGISGKAANKFHIYPVFRLISPISGPNFWICFLGVGLLGGSSALDQKKYTLQSQKFIKIHQFNHLHRQKHRIIDSNPRQIPGRRTGHFLVFLADNVR